MSLIEIYTDSDVNLAIFNDDVKTLQMIFNNSLSDLSMDKCKVARSAVKLGKLSISNWLKDHVIYSTKNLKTSLIQGRIEMLELFKHYDVWEDLSKDVNINSYIKVGCGQNPSLSEWLVDNHYFLKNEELAYQYIRNKFEDYYQTCKSDIRGVDGVDYIIRIKFKVLNDVKRLFDDDVITDSLIDIITIKLSFVLMESIAEKDLYTIKNILTYEEKDEATFLKMLKVNNVCQYIINVKDESIIKSFVEKYC